MSTTCRDIRPVLAECLMLGVPLPDDVAEHVDWCPECCREAADIKEVARTLRRAAPRADMAARRMPLPAAATAPFPALVSAPPELGDKVRRGVAEARRARTRRNRIVVRAAMVAAAAAAIIVPVLPVDHAQAPPAAVALAREGRMIQQPWGTEVPVVLTGLLPGQTYRLMTADASGDRIPGGSVRIPYNEAVHMRIMTALPRQAITSLLVEDQNGRVVARMPVSSPASTTST
jgi:hypothetical protein